MSQPNAKASTQLVLVVAIVQGLMFANRKHLYDSSRMVVTNVRAQAYGSNPSKLTSPAVSVQPLPAFRGPDSGVGQSHLTNRPIVHSPLMNASLPPVHARRIPSACNNQSQTHFLHPALSYFSTNLSIHSSRCRPTMGTRSADANASDGTSVHSSRDFCTGRDGTSTSKLRTPESGSNE